MNFGKIVLVIFAALAVVGGGYLLTLFSPGAVEDESFMYVGSDKENAELLLESERLEKEFEEKATKLGMTEQVIELLRKAIRHQEVYIDRAITRDRAPAERLIKLKTRLQNLEAKPLSEVVDSLEKKAKEAEARNDIVGAEKYFSQAYSMQNKINIDYGLSEYKNVHRALSFDNLAKMMKSRPIYLQSVEAEKKAREAINSQKWDVAKDEFEKAIAYLSKINSEFPNSIYTDFSRLQSLDIELESLKSASLYMKLESMLKKAEEAKAKKDFPSAAEAYGDAEELQRTINKIYPHSRHSSEENLAKLQKDKVNALSWDYANAINSLEAKLADSIKKGDVESAAEIATNLLYKAEQFVADDLRSELVNPDLVLKLRYINFMIREISQVQALVKRDLISIGSISMLKSEVSQKLFKLVMKENPSRYVGDDLPVDSVSYEDVERFCTRLSWLMSEKITLPSVEEFKNATGSLRYADLNDISWNNRNSGGRTHPVATKKANDKGFYDLLGNVEEFVQAQSGSDEIPVIGGSAQTTTDSILDFARKTVDAKTRNRVLGFRIVVR